MRRRTIRRGALLFCAILGIGVVILVARFASRSSTPTARPPFTPSAYRERAKVPALAYAAVTRDRDVLLGADGPADANTTFEAASIAKLFIAVAVMQLIDERKVTLDADVSPYVGFTVRHPTDPLPITFRMLLTHTSSIKDDDMSAAPGGPPLESFLEKYLARPEAFDTAGPGTKSAYSNVGPSLAALAVQGVSKTPFAEHVKRKIFDPIQMTRTTFNVPLEPFAAPHAGAQRLPPASHALWPVVDLFSTATDLARFARGILRGQLVGAYQHQLMLTEHLGWQERKFGGRFYSGHEGEDKGASTGLYLDSSGGTAAVFLANGDAFTSNDPNRAKALQDLVEALFDEASRASQ